MRNRPTYSKISRDYCQMIAFETSEVVHKISHCKYWTTHMQLIDVALFV